MSLRLVQVRYIAETGALVKALENAAEANEGLKKSSEDAEASVTESHKNMTKAAAGLILGLGYAVSKFVEFDKTMSGVQAATGETGKGLESLRQAALSAGADTKFSATEAAEGIRELSKAGMSTDDILSGGLLASLNLAAAGQMDVAEAAETSALALAQFNLQGKDATHVADLLAAGANSAQGEVSDLAMALQQSGLVASQTGLSIDETTAALSAFANKGLLGSDAGTSFKTMLMRLTPQSKEASDMMAKLGLTAYDANGNFVGLAEYAGRLQDSLRNLTPEQRNAALQIMFGSDAVRAANVLYSEGATGIQSWTDKVDQTGYAAKQAAVLTDNLSGDLERLGGSFDTVLIQGGSGANGALRTLVQTAEKLVDAVGQIPGPLLTVGVGLTALALLGPKVSAIGAKMFAPMVTGSQRFREEMALQRALAGPTAVNMSRIGTSATNAAGSVSRLSVAMGAANATVGGLKGAASGALGMLGGPWGLAFMAGTVALMGWANAQANAAADVKELTATMDEQTGAVTENTRTLAASKIDEVVPPDLHEKLSNAGLDFDKFYTDIAAGGQQAQDALGRFQQAMNDAGEGPYLWADPGKDIKDFVGLVDTGIVKKKQDIAANVGVGDSAKQASVGVDQFAGSLGGASDETGTMTNLLVQLGAQSDEAKQQIAGLTNAIDLLGGGERASRAAHRNLAKEIADSGLSAKLTAAQLEELRKSGKITQESMDGLAEATGNTIKADMEAGKSRASLIATYNQGRAAVLQSANALGLHGDAAEAEADKIMGTRGEFKLLLDEYAKTPSQVATTIKTPGMPAARENVRRIGGELEVLPGSKSIYVNAYTSAAMVAVQALKSSLASLGSSVSVGVAMKRASGGPIIGPGTGTSDSVLVAASNGEHMLQAREVDMLGGHQAVYRMRADIRSGALKYDVGGAIGQAYAYRSASAHVSSYSTARAGTVSLDASDRALLLKVAAASDRPVQVHTSLEMDGRKVAQSVTKHQSDAAAMGGTLAEVS